MGDRARNHDGHISYSDAVPRDAALRPHAGGRSYSDARLGRLRHAARRVSSDATDAGTTETGIRLGVPGVLSLVIHCPRIVVPRNDQASGEALLLCGRLEKVRAAVGCGD